MTYKNTHNKIKTLNKYMRKPEQKESEKVRAGKIKWSQE